MLTPDRLLSRGQELLDPDETVQELIAVATFLKRRVEARESRVFPQDAAQILQWAEADPDELRAAVRRWQPTRLKVEKTKQELIDQSNL